MKSSISWQHPRYIIGIFHSCQLNDEWFPFTIFTKQGFSLTDSQQYKMSSWILFRRMKYFKYSDLLQWHVFIISVCLFFYFFVNEKLWNIMPDTSELRGEFWLKWESDMTMNFCVFKSFLQFIRMVEHTERYTCCKKISLYLCFNIYYFYSYLFSCSCLFIVIDIYP